MTKMNAAAMERSAAKFRFVFSLLIATRFKRLSLAAACAMRARPL
ncbi:hypothetical protein [Rhizobium sp. 32_C3_N1_1]